MKKLATLILLGFILFTVNKNAQAQAPTVQACCLSTAGTSTSYISVNWVNGNGSKRIVTCALTSSSIANPVTGGTYTASSTFGSGSNLGSANYCVYNGTASGTTIFGLAANTQYRIRVYEYNTVFTTEYYNTSATSYYEYTLEVEPTVSASSLSFSNVTVSGATLAFTSGSGTYDLLALRASSSYANVPLDGTNYLASSSYGAGDYITGTSPYPFVLSDNTATTVAATSLSAGTTYTAAVFPYSGASGAYNFKTTSYPTTTFTTLATEPYNYCYSLAFSNITSTSMTVSWNIPSSAGGTYRIVTCKPGTVNSDLPSDATYYIPGSVYGTGNQIGGASGAYCVYNGYGNMVNVTGLTTGTSYCFSVFEYNVASNTYNNTYNYYTAGYLTGAQATPAAEPTSPASSLVFSSITSNSFRATWVNGNGNRRVVGLAAGRKQTALSFDGSNDYIEVPYNAALQPTGALTAECWAYRSNWATSISGNQTLLGNTETGGYSIDLTGTTVVGYLRRNGSYATPTADIATLNPGWHHFALTYDGQTTRVFVDATERAFNDAGAYYPIQYTYANSLIIGAEVGSTTTPTGGEYFNGRIDEVRVWSVSSYASLLNSYMSKTLVGNEYGLKGYWKLDDGFTTTSVATSSAFTTGINGTLNGFASTVAASNFTSTTGWVHSGAKVNVPLDFNYYADNSTFMSTSASNYYYGNLYFTVYKGPDSTSVTVTGLSPATYYTMGVFDYNGITGDNNYLTDSYAIGEVLTTTVAAPTITSFTPASGFVGSTVTINGTGFNTTLASNVVYFGAAKATVLSVNAGGTVMTVRVPGGSTYDRISVTNNTLTAYSTKAFDVTSPCGSVTFSASTLNAGVNTTSYYPSEIRIADIDQDGLSDVVGMYSSYTSITRNTSASGTVNLSNIYYFYNGYTTTYDLDVADFDGDGKKDILFGNSYGSNGSFAIMRNTSTIGSITMASNVEFPGIAGYTVNDVSVADFDKDGKPDVVLAYNNNVLSFFRNISSVGNIRFATRTDVSVAAASVINAIAIGDLDSDGKLDVAIAGGSSSQLHFLRNTSTAGSITFAAYTSVTLTGTLTGIEIGDIDTDTKPEVLYGASASTVGILKNNSTVGSISISASPTVLTTLGNTPNNIRLGDIDGDAKADVAVGYTTGNQISIFKNVSTATISVNTKFDFTMATGTASNSLGICDLNNDSKADLISTTASTYTSYFQNNINPLASEPTVQASGLTFAGVTTSQITCNFTPGNGANKVVFVRAATSPAFSPIDGVGYVPNTTFGSGSDLGGGNYCVMDGNASGVTVSGLQSNTSYIFSVYEYNGVLNCQYNYMPNSTGNSAAQATNNNPPTLNAIADPASICQSSGLQTINLSGISTGSGSEVQTLTITASSSNTGLIPTPTVTYVSPAATGTLSYTPVAGVSGTAVITVTINDGATNNNILVRTFTVTVDHTPTVSTAGPNQTVCPSVATLAGNTPAYGTGVWTIIATTSGAIAITSPTNPTTTVTGFAIGDSATFRWTISNGACASSGNNARVKRISCPTTADFTANTTSQCLSGTPVVTYTDASVASGASIISWNWNFGAGAFPPSATGAGPHTVSYSTAGSKTVSLQVTDNLAASDIEIKTGFVTINDVPAPSGNVSGTATVCQGQNGVAYSVPAILGATGYTWSLPSGATLISGVNTNNITVDYGASAISGNITCTGTNSCGSGVTSANFPVTINPLPAAAGAITGLTSVCDGATSVIYTVSPILNATTYNWTVPGGVIIMSGGTTNSITVNYVAGSAGGTISVNGVNSCGNGTSASTNVTVNPYPEAADMITGQISITTCPSTSGVTYSIPLVNNATSYTWSVPSGATIVSGTGTNSITVDYSSGATSGTVMVTPTNSCGTGASSSLNITVNTLPDAAGSIIGSDTITVCPVSDSIVYSVPTVFNADYYVWTLPSGATIVSGDSTSSIMVNFSNTAVSGSISVYGENACGVGATATFEIVVNPVPTQELCMVSVDPTSTFNVVTWEKPVSLEIDSFRIYREVLSSFVQIGAVPYDSLSEYNDSTFLPAADPNTTNFRYKISVVDTCGNESTLSNHHRTIFLQANQGVGGVVNLNWVPYEGATVDFYRILRDTLGTGIYVAIDSVPGSNTVYTDNAPPVVTTNVSYLLESNWAITCTPTRASINTTRSNIKNMSLTVPGTGVAEQALMNAQINVYPNPAMDQFTIEYPSGFKQYQLQILDALGQLVSSEPLEGSSANGDILTHTVDASTFNKGVYIVNIQTEFGNSFKRVIIQ